MDPFQPMIEGLQRATDGLKRAHEAMVQASGAMVQASEGLTHLAEAMRTAYGEHEDMRETIHRLERLVLELRDRIDGQQS